ncbi:MAG: fimbrillin family protein, partial [Tannerella sp.]|nr:fimbrillin family protein [Tannerella sp.]
MNTFLNLVCSFSPVRISDPCRRTHSRTHRTQSGASAIFLLMSVLSLMITSCETEYIKETPDVEEPTFSAKEGNFNIDITFATYGEEDGQATARRLESSDPEAAKREMEPETNVIRVRDDLYIYATLAVDPVDQAPPVRTRTLNPGARIRIAVYDTVAGVFTRQEDILYRDSSNFLVRDDGSGFKIQLSDGYYKLVAYSYNSTALPSLADPADSIYNVNSINDLIWGESETVQISGNAPVTIPITMYHKMSQVRLVAKMRDGSPGIYGLSPTVDMLPGYTANMSTFTGEMTRNGTSPTTFTFPSMTFPKDSFVSETRTVYTAEEIPTIIRIGTLTIGSGGTPDTTITDIPATFAKSLRSGYSYTMTMNIGESPEITDDAPPAGFVPYIGAFWRASQTGERLLRMPVTTGEADSVWTARVIEGGDWIMLDKEQSADPGLYTSSAAIDTSASFGSSYTLSASSTASDFVSGFVRLPSDPAHQTGDDEIYFRIGLRNPLPGGATAAPRYGVVLLTYGNNRYRHRIWIRQGEADDFVMRNGDPLVGGNRTLAARFSPFNLTANALPEYAGTSTSVTVPLNGGNFVKFPTQGGAVWYWATDAAEAPSYLRRAYHGSNPLDFTPWLNDILDSGYRVWNDITASANNSETCPAGYRRPNDGPTDNFVSNPSVSQSEIRQSLWLNPPTGENNNTENSVWGFYADGFFDRYNLEEPMQGGSGGNPVAADWVKPNAVKAGTVNAAYMGRIVYNPYNFASLFLPAAGMRGGLNEGQLDLTGNRGWYWTSTSEMPSLHNAWSLDFYAGVDNNDMLQVSSSATIDVAVSIRCVKTEVPPAPPIPDMQGSPYVWVGAFWKYNQMGERLIRWTNSGPWTATVTVDGGMGVKMDQNLPANTAVEWLPSPTGILINGNEPSFETNYQVPGNQTTVSGNGDIYFRIGLGSLLTSPTAHRYGKITVTYDNGTETQDIYLRQGDYPDYLFPGRTNTKAFTAYNLTVDNDPWTVGNGGLQMTDHRQLTAQGVLGAQGAGAFVDYPTQAGAYFQW